MSLFEKDQLVFSFIMAMRLFQHTHGVDQMLWQFLLTGFLPDEVCQSHHGFDERTWKTVASLSRFEGLEGLQAHFEEYPYIWHRFIEERIEFPGVVPFDEFTKQLPSPFNDATVVPPVQRLCLLRATRPEDMLDAVRAFIYSHLGSFYLSPPLVQLADVLERSEPRMPLIFIITPGNDPQSRLASFAV